MTNTINELTELCDSAYRHDHASWDQEAKLYRGSDGPDRAEALSGQPGTNDTTMKPNPSIEERQTMSTHSEPINHLSRTRRIVALCQESGSLWEPVSKRYPGGDTRAKAIAKEIEQTRRTLATDVVDRLTGNDCHLLRTPPVKRQQFASRQWRSFTWIDLLYQEDTDGNPVDYDFISSSDRGAHLFRIWFTASGVGIGIRPAAHKTHMTRANLINDLPAGYPDREPLSSHGHESRHELCLKGRPGPTNQYFATWVHNGFETDEAFLEAVDSAWSEVGPVLNRYRC